MKTQVFLVTGGTSAARSTAVQSLLAALPVHAPTALWVNRTLFLNPQAMPPELPRDGGLPVSVKYLAGGCLCCSARQVMRVELVRMRRQRPLPAYLIIDLDPTVEVLALENFLRSAEWASAYVLVENQPAVRNV